MNEDGTPRGRNVRLTGARSLLVALTIFLPWDATAQDGERPQIVPVEKAAFHVPAFRNEYLRGGRRCITGIRSIMFMPLSRALN
jgi:hypothetical protein